MMKVLCLHGAGSNNKIFELQTATLRSLLPEFSFEFVEGTEPHLEGSWSKHYHLSHNDHNTPLYTYCQNLDLKSMLAAELDLLDLLLDEDPPFDGVLAYSSGAALAAQVFLRHERQRAEQMDSQPLFRFMILCNSVTPGRVFLLDEEGRGSKPSSERRLKEEALEYIDIIAGFRIKAMPQLEPQMKFRRIQDRALLEKKWTSMVLPGKTSFLTDGEFCVTSVDGNLPTIFIPTLHILDLTEPRLLGTGMLDLCDERLAKVYRHSHGHEFPRGYSEMKEIARMVREVAERACS